MSSPGKSPRLEPLQSAESEVKRSGAEFHKDATVEMHQAGIKSFEIFKSHFLLGKENIPNLRILMVNTGTDVSVMEAFPDSKVTFIEEGSGATKRLKSVGLRAFKRNYRVQRELPDFNDPDEEPGRFNLAVILDPEAEPTPKFLQCIEGNGWVLCRARMAGALRAGKDYKIIGAIGKDGPAPTFIEGSHGKMWGYVETDADLKAESENPAPGVVTYNEAIKALKNSGMDENEVDKVVKRERVVEEYRKLLKESPNRRELKEIPLKTQDEELIFVLQKSGRFAH